MLFIHLVMRLWHSSKYCQLLCLESSKKHYYSSVKNSWEVAGKHYSLLEINNVWKVAGIYILQEKCLDSSRKAL